MSVYVCIKQVPNLEGVPSADPASGFRQADAWYLNPLDAYALRGALHTAAAQGVDCVAVSCGGPQVEEGLRQALGLGAERAILVTCPDPLPGSALTARALAGAILTDAREHDCAPRLVFCGRQSSDIAGLQVPYRLAACLDLAVVSEVSAWQVDGNRVDVFRQAGSLREYLEVDLPCVLALNRGQGEMPHPTLPGLLKAKKKRVRVMALAESAAALPPQWAGPGADPPMLRAHNVDDARQCRFIAGDTVEARVRELVRLLRADGSLPS